MTTSYTHPRTEMAGFLPHTAKRVLDIGCSTGAFGEVLRREQNLQALVGVEPNPTAALQAKAVYDDVVVGLFPDVSAEIPGAESYDAVYFNDVLEHMTHPDAALAAVEAFLTPGAGVVIASIPNVRHISALGPLVIRDEFRYRESGILDTTHLRFFTARSIRRLFEDSGWAIQAMRGINLGLYPGDPKRRRWIRALGWLTRGRSDPFFVVQYVVVAKPRR